MQPDGSERTVIDAEEVTLQTTFPTRKYTEEDKSKTLLELGTSTDILLSKIRQFTFD